MRIIPARVIPVALRWVKQVLFVFSLVLGVGLFGVEPLWATTFASTTLPEKITTATHIVLGTVREIAPRALPNGIVVTDVYITPSLAMKGFHYGAPQFHLH